MAACGQVRTKAFPRKRFLPSLHQHFYGEPEVEGFAGPAGDGSGRRDAVVGGVLGCD